MNVTIKDYAIVLLMLADMNEDFGETPVSIESVLGPARKVYGADSEIVKIITEMFELVAEVGVERKCAELREELKDL